MDKNFSLEECVLGNDEFKIFLANKYAISKHPTLGEYIFNDKLYSSLNDALLAARAAYIESREDFKEASTHILGTPRTSSEGTGFAIGRFVAERPKVAGAIVAGVLAIFSLSAYQGHVEEERRQEQALASKLGFDSIEEMKKLNSMGFADKTKFLDAEAKKLGFSTNAEMKEWLAKGAKTGKEKEELIAKAKSLGFDGFDQMQEIQALGFNTMAEKIAKDKIDEQREREEEAKRVAQFKAEEDARKAQEEEVELQQAIRRRFKSVSDMKEYDKNKPMWRENCRQFNEVKYSCATATDVRRCLEIRLGTGYFYTHEMACVLAEK
jgi:hypothetical protein